MEKELRSTAAGELVNVLESGVSKGMNIRQVMGIFSLGVLGSSYGVMVYGGGHQAHLQYM